LLTGKSFRLKVPTLGLALIGAVAAGGAFIAFAVVAYLLDRGDLKAVVARLRRTRGTSR
jgi:hypothetical protein